MNIRYLLLLLTNLLAFPIFSFAEIQDYSVCAFPSENTTQGRTQAADAYMEFWKTNDPDVYYDELIDTESIKTSIINGEIIIYMNNHDGSWNLTTFRAQSADAGGWGMMVKSDGCPTAWPVPEEPKKEEAKTDLVPLTDAPAPTNCVLEGDQVTCESPSGEKITTNCQDTPELCELAQNQTPITPPEQDPGAATASSPAINSSGAESPATNAAGVSAPNSSPSPVIKSGLLPSGGQANFDGGASSSKGPMMLASLPDDKNNSNPDTAGPSALPEQETGTEKIKTTSKKLSQAATNERLWISNPPSQLVKYDETSSPLSKNPLTRLKDSVDRFLSCFNDDNAARLSGDSALGCISREVFGW